MNTDTANLFTARGRLIQEHVKKYKNRAAELKDWSKKFYITQTFKPAEVDQRKLRVADACKRAAETLKRRSEERGSDYCAHRDQETSKESA